MSLTLKEILQKKKEQAERVDRPKVDYFSLTNNNPARIRFLQELDTESKNYDPARGSAYFSVEHTSPHNFKQRAECTYETEGRCFACEMATEEPDKGWWQKTNMYIQVFDAKDESVKVLSRPALGTFLESLYGWAEDENDGSIVGPTFKITKGANKKDPWVVMPTNRELEVPEASLAQMVDLSKIGFKVEYDKQKKFYLPAGSTEERPEESKPKFADDDVAW